MTINNYKYTNLQNTLWVPVLLKKTEKKQESVKGKNLQCRAESVEIRADKQVITATSISKSVKIC